MCRIYYAKRVSKYPARLEEQTSKAIEAELAYSASINSDGFGMLLNGKVEKVTEGFEAINTKFIEAIKGLEVGQDVYLHHRMATQGGLSLENTQPIETENLVVIHNGHLDKGYYKHYNHDFTTAKYYGPYGRKAKESKQSDTLEFASELQELYSFDDLTLSQLVEEVLDGYYGSFSMFIIDKLTGEAVYTKSSNTNFTFWYLPDNGLVIGSTSDSFIDCFGQSIGYFVKDSEHYTFGPLADSIYTMDSITGCF